MLNCIDDFIGSELIGLSGNVLTLVSLSHRTERYLKYYNVSCSVCNKDIELFPDTFKAPKSTLVKGMSPCGCNKRYSYSEYQQNVRMERLCANAKVTFLGFYDKYSVPSKTRCNMLCPLHGEWHTSTITGLHWNCSCPTCSVDEAGLRHRTPDEDIVVRLNALGRFPKGSTFERDIETKGYRRCYDTWWMYCPVCEKDEYCLGGVCDGKFKSNLDALSKGKVPCRCSTGHNLTRDQIDFKVKLECTKKGFIFDRWEGENRILSSKFFCTCARGHKRNPVARSFVVYGADCKVCATTTSSFNLIKNEAKSTDYCYLLLFEDELNKERFIKIGRSLERCYYERIKTFKRKYKVTELGLNKGVHKDIVLMECMFHQKLANLIYKPYKKFSGSKQECFSFDALDNIGVNIDFTFKYNEIEEKING